MSRGRERYTPSEFEAAVEAVLAGASYKATQGVIGVPANTLRKYVVRHGLERRSVPQRGAKGVPATVVKLALDALANGESREQAAESAGMAVSTLRTYLRGQGGAMTPTCTCRAGELRAAEREEIRVGVTAGESGAAIAERIGRHRSTVWREIARNGGRGHYRAAKAEVRAGQSALRPRPVWTEDRPWLWTEASGPCGRSPGCLTKQCGLHVLWKGARPRGAGRPCSRTKRWDPLLGLGDTRQ